MANLGQGGEIIVLPTNINYNKVRLWYDQGFTVDLIPFDFVKPFKRVQILLDKHRRVGISGSLLMWIVRFVLGMSMGVSVGGSLSNSAPIGLGPRIPTLPQICELYMLHAHM